MAKVILNLPSPAPGTHRTLAVHRYGRPGAHPKAYFQAAPLEGVDLPVNCLQSQ